LFEKFAILVLKRFWLLQSGVEIVFIGIIVFVFGMNDQNSLSYPVNSEN